jgi:hypothetical protein
VKESRILAPAAAPGDTNWAWHGFYDGQKDGGISHYHRHIGMATMELPIVP